VQPYLLGDGLPLASIVNDLASRLRRLHSFRTFVQSHAQKWKANCSKHHLYFEIDVWTVKGASIPQIFIDPVAGAVYMFSTT